MVKVYGPNGAENMEYIAPSKKIFGLISKVMVDVGAVGKSGFNEHGRYKFRTIDDVYNALHPALSKNGVFFMPNVIESHEEKFQSKNGANQIRIKLRVRYDVYADDGSMISTTVEGEGIDTSDKATNKALTAAFKYMLIQVFCIPLEGQDDADKGSPEAPPPKKAEPEDKAFDEATRVYSATFGKFKGIPINTISVDDLVSYVQYIEKEAKAKGKPPQQKVLDFIREANNYIDANT